MFAEGIRRWRTENPHVRARPDILFSDFGTRRRFAGLWQYYIDEVLRDELNQQLSTGLSLDSEYLCGDGGRPGADGLFRTRTADGHRGPLDEGGAIPGPLHRAQRQVIDDWWEQYGWGLSIFLPDTFGTDFFFSGHRRRPAPMEGFRWDSGNLFEFGERVIAAYGGSRSPPGEDARAERRARPAAILKRSGGSAAGSA